MEASAVHTDVRTVDHMDVLINVRAVVPTVDFGTRTDVSADEHSDGRMDILIVLPCDKDCQSGPYRYRLPPDSNKQNDFAPICLRVVWAFASIIEVQNPFRPDFALGVGRVHTDPN